MHYNVVRHLINLTLNIEEIKFDRKILFVSRLWGNNTFADSYINYIKMVHNKMGTIKDFV